MTEASDFNCPHCTCFTRVATLFLQPLHLLARGQLFAYVTYVTYVTYITYVT